MAFIKIQNVVINTNYIAVVELDNQTSFGEKSVSVLIATSKFPLFQWDTNFPNRYYCQWAEFICQAAKALQDSFTSFNNVIDLLPQYQEKNAV